MATSVQKVSEARLQNALARLRPPHPDGIFYAFGKGDARYLYGTTKGYIAKALPEKAVALFETNTIRRVVCATFGDDADCWFFTLETTTGGTLYRFGKAIPGKLGEFLVAAAPLSPVRVVLGPNGAFFAWNKTGYRHDGVPNGLVAFIRQYTAEASDNIGTWKGPTPVHLTFHQKGAYYIEFPPVDNPAIRRFLVNRSWNLPNAAMVNSISRFLGMVLGRLKPDSPQLDRVLYIGFNPYSPNGSECVMVKLNSDGSTERLWFGRDLPLPDYVPLQYKKAKALRSGRSHPRDTDELLLKAGEILKVLQEINENWIIAENQSGERGWVFRAWVKSADTSAVNPTDIYVEWKDTCDGAFGKGSMKVFPGFMKEMNTCKDPKCAHLKGQPQNFGVCKHDVAWLLEGSGRMSLDFLKEERVRWHPDRFARSCHPEFKEELTKKAQYLFVLIGQIMGDMMRSESG